MQVIVTVTHTLSDELMGLLKTAIGMNGALNKAETAKSPAPKKAEDPAAEVKTETPAQAAAEEKPIVPTIEAVREATANAGKAKAIAVLAELGCGKITELKPEQRSEFIKRLNAA